MEARHLRIGNLLQLKDQWFEDNHEPYGAPRIVRVDEIRKESLADEVYYVSGYNLSDLEGILLSEDWLESPGRKIERLNDGWHEVKLDDFFTLQFQTRDQWNKEDGYHLLVNGSEYDSDVAVRYVHDFQNLYHGLFKREFEFKKTIYEARNIY